MDRATLTGQTILVVEEQPIIALDLQTALQDAGAIIVIARDAAEALARSCSWTTTIRASGASPCLRSSREIIGCNTTALFLSPTSGAAPPPRAAASAE